MKILGKQTNAYTGKKKLEYDLAQLQYQLSLAELDSNERLAYLDADTTLSMQRNDADDNSDVIKIAVVAIAIAIVAINIKN